MLESEFKGIILLCCEKVAHCDHFSQVNKGNLHGWIKFRCSCIYVIVCAINNTVCALKKC